jgi:hypothetical protein
MGVTELLDIVIARKSPSGPAGSVLRRDRGLSIPEKRAEL